MTTSKIPPVLLCHNRIIKRCFDILLAMIGLVTIGWLIALAFFIALFDTRQNGFFFQKRVGRNGKMFYIVKIRTMRILPGIETNVTSEDDPRITRIGHIFRKLKIDELPQLFNVLLGQMSFVGPRPDVPGFADQLVGRNRIILDIRPGITGPATLYFRNEEQILAQQENPETYNSQVIYPKKVQLNIEYMEHYSFYHDIYYIWKTIIPF